MIKNGLHATEVQTRRFKSGKKGTAKSVRRYVKKRYPETYKKKIRLFPTRWEAVTIKKVIEAEQVNAAA